ncbi:nucleotidyltransferase domain-containing protein [Luteibacter sp. 22Crub2.1]|uniref:nucleotidyltransferase domain-containing protein n=1 Tax=Luteibacter sp. 22Crub2.1 TaxID=1283288 RepID=UPI0009C80760|nr:nucleotidyltransferase domain-containing protein [Luteibacter sp. 22Crub2.1]SKB59134.1 Nucleotidyltransferase domain-containing protein [Luteibacter sp. 22Crub2.1]
MTVVVPDVALRLRNFVRRSMRARFSGAKACLFFGSAVRGDVGAESDLDVIVIQPESIASYHEHYHLAGFTFDVFALTESTLVGMLRGQELGHVDYFERAIRDAVVLWDDDGVAARFVDRVEKNGLARRPFQDWMPHRLTITSLLKDAKSGLTDFHASAACSDLYIELVRVWILKRGFLLGSAKHMVDLMYREDAGQCQSLHHAFRLALAGDAASFHNLAEEMLARIGGPFLHGERLYMQASHRGIR